MERFHFTVLSLCVKRRFLWEGDGRADVRTGEGAHKGWGCSGVESVFGGGAAQIGLRICDCVEVGEAFAGGAFGAGGEVEDFD